MRSTQNPLLSTICRSGCQFAYLGLLCMERIPEVLTFFLTEKSHEFWHICSIFWQLYFNQEWNGRYLCIYPLSLSVTCLSSVYLSFYKLLLDSVFMLHKCFIWKRDTKKLCNVRSSYRKALPVELYAAFCGKFLKDQSKYKSPGVLSESMPCCVWGIRENILSATRSCLSNGWYTL